MWQKLKRFDFLLLNRRETRWLVMFILAALAVLLWYLFTYLQPPPPKLVRIITGSEAGAYFKFAKQYEPLFAKHGITLEILTSAGSVENLARLKDKNEKIDLAFVQGGVASASDNPQVESLASVAYEPVWVFYNKKAFAGAKGLEQLSALNGKSIAIGPQGSGVRAVATELLTLNKITQSNTKLLDLSGALAVKELVAGNIDAAFLVAAIESPAVQDALASGLGLLSFEQAEAYSRLFPWVAKITLPKGAANMSKNLPEQDIQLIAATANLVTRSDLHRAIMFLSLDIASGVHRQPSALSTVGDFPSEKNLDFAQASESERFFKTGRPFLQRYVPFWLANLIERLLLLLGPMLAIGFPLVKLFPSLIDWKERSELAQIYDEILDLEYGKYADQAGRDKALARLNQIEEALPHLGLTAHFYQGLFSLKKNIELARRRIIEKGKGSEAAGAHISHGKEQLDTEG